MNTDLQFTRYLYGKDEVEIAFMTNLLNKKEEAIFWAYELFHSGFIKELTTLLWKIYYDFYAVINPAFETYLVTKLKDINLIDDKLVYTLIKNFMIRRHNIDVFILRNIVNEFDVECDTDLIRLLDSKDYLTISSYILENIKEDQVIETFNKVVLYFSKSGLKIDSKKAKCQFEKQKIYINNRILLLSRVIHYFSILHKIKMGRNLYIHTEPKECVIYETINSNLTIPQPYKILPLARVCYIDHCNYLSLFKLKRDKTDMTIAYRENWLYHASFSPLWKERINHYNGEILSDKTVIFNDDEDEEKFREKYDYEPDEQKKDVQDKSIQEIKSERTWISFYKEHRNETIVEIDEDIIKDIEKIIY